MGLRDALGVLCAGQQISADGQRSTCLDLNKVAPRLGVGPHAPMLCIRTAVAPTQAGDTLGIEVRTSASSDGTDLSGTEKTVFAICGNDLAELPATDARLATAGAWIYRGRLPYEANQRYLQLYFQNGTSTGVFTIDAWLEDEAPSDFRGGQVLSSPVGNP